MKLLVLAENLDVRSGWGRYAFEVTSEYKKRGVAFDLLTTDKLLPISAANLIPNVLRVRRAITPQTSHIHSFDIWPLGVYAILASLGKKIPVFLTGVGTYSIPPQSGAKAYLMRWAFRKAKEVFCISNYTRERIKNRIVKGNLSVVHWGTTHLPKLLQSEMETYKNQFKIPPGKRLIVLTVGHVKHRKGQLETLKAVKILKAKYPEILYVILGPTSDKEYLALIKEYADENGLASNFVIIDNQKGDRELAFFYSICDVFAMNSNNDGDHFEGFGLVFIEAGQFAKPAVGSRGCGIEDAIRDEVTGLLSSQGSENDIAEKIDRVFQNKKEMGLRAHEYSKKFSWQTTVDKYYNSYVK